MANTIEEDEMPNYMLLLYATEADRAEVAERDVDLPEWKARLDELAERGVLLGTGRLHPADTATTVRLVDGEAELTDGPFAVTKEILGGYILVDVPDLDEAVKIAAVLPIARFGKVEIRPEMAMEEIASRSEEATAAG
ncbi:MAG TPA: YciI family protein [Solirubrobacterales bacterium]